MKAAITQLITENRLKEALQKLAEIVSEAHRGEVAVLQSRLTELDQNISRGTISRSDITIERNQIVHAALGLLALSPDTGISATVSNANAPQDPSPEDNGKQNKILFLAANPANATRLQTDKEHRILKAEYSRGSIPATFLPPQFALTLGELQRALDDEPTIIHFSGHGDEDGIIITNEQNQHELLKPFALERIFKRMQGKTKLVILNACFSSIQAKTISGFDMVVLGANHEVEDEACIKFSKAFYSALGRGKSFEQCYDEAITEVGNYDEDEASLFEAWQEGQKLDW